jgi:YD repeat-containing protein
VLADGDPLVAVPTTGCTYRYDGRGSVAEVKSAIGVPGRTFTYDGLGRVTRMTSGGAVASYRYDPLGEVAALDVAGAAVGDNRHDRRYGGLVERSTFLIGGAVVEAVVERRVPGPQGVFLARRDAGAEAEDLYWHGDGQANRLFTDATGHVVQKPDYLPFGQVAADTAATGTATHTKYLWNGGDTLGGFGLTHLGARHYDPEIGRFL